MHCIRVLGDLGTNLKKRKQKSLQLKYLILTTALISHWHMSPPHASKVRGQILEANRLDTERVRVFPYSGVRDQRDERQGKGQSEASYWSWPGCVCCWGCALVSADIAPECEPAAAPLNAGWWRGSPSESKHHGQTEDRFDTAPLSSLWNVWTETIGEYFPPTYNWSKFSHAGTCQECKKGRR